MSKDYKDLLVALDIGTSKVVAIVAELKGEGHYEVIGLGQSDSKGLKKGVVVNIEATVQSIQRALEEADRLGVFFRSGRLPRCGASPQDAVECVRPLARPRRFRADQLDIERDYQGELGRTADYAEGVAAFTQKRPPQFTGR